jgi:plastocyanin
MRRTTEVFGLCAIAMCVFLMSGAAVQTPEIEVTGRIVLQSTGASVKVPNASGAVVWLTQVPGVPDDPPVSTHASGPLRVTQRNKTFEPHLLIVPVGAAVEFPNRDPFFHNVFSLFEGKRFDLGLYEAGTTRKVHFDRSGVSYIFCNIHPEMSAVVIALDTPYYAVSNQRGEIVIPGVPPGRYLLHVWHQSSPPDALGGLTHQVNLSHTDASLGVIRLVTTSLPPHKNKYGRDYDPPTPASPVYVRP